MHMIKQDISQIDIELTVSCHLKKSNDYNLMHIHNFVLDYCNDEILSMIVAHHSIYKIFSFQTLLFYKYQKVNVSMICSGC